MKRLPTALVLGLVIQLVFDSVRIEHWLHGDNVDFWARWELLESAFDVATAALIASGLFELARGLRDRAALGARIAGWAQIGQLGLAGFWIAAAMWSQATQKGMHILDHIELASRYLQALIVLATAVGIWLAMRNAALGIITVVVAVAGVPVPVLGDLYRKLELGHTTGILLTMSPYVILSALALAQLWLGAGGVELPPPAVPPNMAFTRASKALWLRLIAAVSLAGITFLAALSSGAGTEGMASMLKAVTMLAPIVDALALAMFAIAVLQLSRTQIAPWLTAVGAACALWATGAIAGHLSATYQRLYGSDHDSYPYGGHDHVTGLYMTLVPLVSGAGIALVLMAVAKLARSRQQDEIRENVAVRTGVFIALTLGVLFIVNYGLDKIGPESAGLAIFALLAIAGASLYALSLAAKICTQGAELIERDPMGLPVATLVKGGDA